MYKVTIINDEIETVIHNPTIGKMKIQGTIKNEVNKIDSFNISFYMNNPAFGKIKPLKTLINVLNVKTQQYEFEGRVLGPSESMDSSGLHDATYECEGELGYLHDSQQQHLEFRGTPKHLFTTILAYHNSQVEEEKRFEVGDVTVTNSTDNLYLYLSAEKNTFETIKEKILDNIGGELQIRKVDGVRFLDLLERIGEDKETEIKLSKNLITMSRDVDPTQIISRLTPLGTRIESEDEEATDASEARLTIDSVNNGVPYIDDSSLIEEIGIQGGSITWDDITLANNLLSRGKSWLSSQKTSHNQYKISALDLYLIGLDMDSIETGNTYPVKNPVMGIDERLRVMGRSLDINSPHNASLTIGDKFKTLNEYQNDANKSQKKIVDLERTFETQSKKVRELSQASQQAQKEIQTLYDLLENMDMEDIDESLDLIVQQLIQISETINDIGVEITDLELRSGLLEDFKVAQELLNHENELLHDDILERLENLEKQV